MSTGFGSDYFNQKTVPINLGLGQFSESLDQQDVEVIDVTWKPPPEIVPNLVFTKQGVSIDEANDKACQRIIQSQAKLIGM